MNLYIFDSEKTQRGTKIDNKFICPLLEIRIMLLTKEWWLNFNFEQKKILVGEVFPRKEKVPFFEGGGEEEATWRSRPEPTTM